MQPRSPVDPIAVHAVAHCSSGDDVLRARPQFHGITVGTALLCAAPGAGLGGDLIDVFDLDRRFALIVVADICGHGAQAAAQAAFIRYTVRTLAIEGDGDPAVVLAKFNAIYCRTVEDYEAFVVLIIGIVDSQTGEVRYASAGHEPAFLRRDGVATLLPPTGPIVGVSPFSAYRTAVVRLRTGDMLVWTTDGMTESRDTQRRLLGVDGLAAWIGAGPPGVDGMVSALVAALARRSGSRATDDVAVLAVCCSAVPALLLVRAAPPATPAPRPCGVQARCGAPAR
jgi:serine phosphatase RsbU (regulator of sigma subunit)